MLETWAWQAGLSFLRVFEEVPDLLGGVVAVEELDEAFLVEKLVVRKVEAWRVAGDSVVQSSQARQPVAGIMTYLARQPVGRYGGGVNEITRARPPEGRDHREPSASALVILTSLIRHPIWSLSSPSRSSSGISLAFHHPPSTTSCLTSPFDESEPIMTCLILGGDEGDDPGRIKVYLARP